MSSVVRLPKYHPAQRHIVSNAKRFNVVCAGRRTGKTKMGTRLLIEPALRGLPVAWFAPNYKYLEEVWREVGAATRDVTRHSDQTSKRRELVTGGVIDFWTLDGEDAARGRKYARAIIDEAAIARNLQPQWQQAIRPTLTDMIGDAWFLSTPKGQNYFHELAQRGQSQPDNWAFFQHPTSDNPYIDAGEIEDARRDLPELIFRQEYLAEFVTQEGTLLKSQWLKVAEPPVGLTLRMGVDLAISTKEGSDYSAAVILGTDAQGNVFIVHAERVRASFHQVLEWIKALAARWQPSVIHVEQVQFQAAVITELVRTTSLPVKGVRPDRDKVTRFLPLQARYEQGLVWHAPGLPSEFGAELLSFPIGEHDDFVDAAAYAFMEAPRRAFFGLSV
jgi:predicted phage terminase large subunit-like protein